MIKKVRKLKKIKKSSVSLYQQALICEKDIIKNQEKLQKLYAKGLKQIKELAVKRDKNKAKLQKKMDLYATRAVSKPHEKGTIGKLIKPIELNLNKLVAEEIAHQQEKDILLEKQAKFLALQKASKQFDKDWVKPAAAKKAKKVSATKRPTSKKIFEVPVEVINENFENVIAHHEPTLVDEAQ